MVQNSYSATEVLSASMTDFEFLCLYPSVLNVYTVDHLGFHGRTVRADIRLDIRKIKNVRVELSVHGRP